MEWECLGTSVKNNWCVLCVCRSVRCLWYISYWILYWACIRNHSSNDGSEIKWHAFQFLIRHGRFMPRQYFCWHITHHTHRTTTAAAAAHTISGGWWHFTNYKNWIEPIFGNIQCSRWMTTTTTKSLLYIWSNSFDEFSFHLCRLFPKTMTLARHGNVRTAWRWFSYILSIFGF